MTPFHAKTLPKADSTGLGADVAPVRDPFQGGKQRRLPTRFDTVYINFFFTIHVASGAGHTLLV